MEGRLKELAALANLALGVGFSSRWLCRCQLFCRCGCAGSTAMVAMPWRTME